MSNLNWDAILDEQDLIEDEFSAIPAGTYTAVVDSAEAKTAQSGNKMVGLMLSISGGPYNNRKVWTNIVFSLDNANAMRYTLRKLNALGVTREWLAEHNPDTAAIAAAVVGVQVSIEVEVRQWQGEDRNDVKTFRAISGAGTGTPPPPSAPASPDVPSLTPTPAPTPDVPVPTPEENPF